MARKTLIVNGSPRINGDTAALIAELRRHLDGEVIEISAYRSNIAPCVDCRGCWKTAKCVVRDDMDILYGDDFDNVVLASPIYFQTLPGQVLNLMSRFQPWHVAMFFLNQPLVQRPKKAGLILTAGGHGSEKTAMHHVYTFFKLLNAKGFEERIVTSLKTDTVPATEDAEAMAKAKALALWLNED
jgi:multimeric flavodoxin WrbA